MIFFFRGRFQSEGRTPPCHSSLSGCPPHYRISFLVSGRASWRIYLPPPPLFFLSLNAWSSDRFVVRIFFHLPMSLAHPPEVHRVPPTLPNLKFRCHWRFFLEISYIAAVSFICDSPSISPTLLILVVSCVFSPFCPSPRTLVLRSSFFLFPFFRRPPFPEVQELCVAP